MSLPFHLLPIVLMWGLVWRACERIQGASGQTRHLMMVIHDAMVLLGALWLNTVPFAFSGPPTGVTRLFLLVSLAWHIAVLARAHGRADRAETLVMLATTVMLATPLLVPGPGWLTVAMLVCVRSPCVGLRSELLPMVAARAPLTTVSFEFAQTVLLFVSRGLLAPALAISMAWRTPFIPPTPVEALLLAVAAWWCCIRRPEQVASQFADALQERSARSRRASFFT